MNANSLNDLRAVAGTDALIDEKMRQIRQLLIGDHVSRSEERISGLEAKFKELEVGISRQLDALAARIEALAGATMADRRTAMEELAKGLGELGERVHRIARD